MKTEPNIQVKMIVLWWTTMNGMILILILILGVMIRNTTGGSDCWSEARNSKPYIGENRDFYRGSSMELHFK